MALLMAVTAALMGLGTNLAVVQTVHPASLGFICTFNGASSSDGC